MIFNCLGFGGIFNADVSANKIRFFRISFILILWGAALTGWSLPAEEVTDMDTAMGIGITTMEEEACWEVITITTTITTGP